MLPNHCYVYAMRPNLSQVLFSERDVHCILTDASLCYYPVLESRNSGLRCRKLLEKGPRTSQSGALIFLQSVSQAGLAALGADPPSIVSWRPLRSWQAQEDTHTPKTGGCHIRKRAQGCPCGQGQQLGLPRALSLDLEALYFTRLC